MWVWGLNGVTLEKCLEYFEALLHYRKKSKKRKREEEKKNRNKRKPELLKTEGYVTSSLGPAAHSCHIVPRSSIRTLGFYKEVERSWAGTTPPMSLRVHPVAEGPLNLHPQQKQFLSNAEMWPKPSHGHLHF